MDVVKLMYTVTEIVWFCLLKNEIRPSLFEFDSRQTCHAKDDCFGYYSVTNASSYL